MFMDLNFDLNGEYNHWEQWDVSTIPHWTIMTSLGSLG